MLGVSLLGASRPLPSGRSPQKTCFSSAPALATDTAFPRRAQGVREHQWLHQARISSSALLKLGIDRGLICIKRNTRCKGRVHPPPEGGGSHGWDTRGHWQVLPTHHLSMLVHKWPPNANERDAGVSGGWWGTGSGASIGLPLLAWVIVG